MNDHLTALISVENGVVSHLIHNNETNATTDQSVCTHLGHALNKIKEKYGEIDFIIQQDGTLCKPSKPSLFHCITNPQ